MIRWELETDGRRRTLTTGKWRFRCDGCQIEFYFRPDFVGWKDVLGSCEHFSMFFREHTVEVLNLMHQR